MNKWDCVAAERLAYERTRSDMSPSLLVQILGVSHRRDDRGNEGLVYAPTPLVGDGHAAPESAWQPIKTEILERQLESIRRRVEELTWQARLSQPRGSLGIEADAETLGAYVFPPAGFLSIVEPGVQPQFDIVFDIASAIPWEVLEERYAWCRCRDPALYLQRLRPHDAPLHCQHCGKRMAETGGKLAVTRHLTHLVRGGQPPTGVGDEFLIVEDPTQDLFTGQNDPQQLCQAQLQELHHLLAQRGFRINVLKGQHATTRRLLKALENESLVGLYYFGHGYFPQDGDQGCLLLADGPLYAGEIEASNPNVRFVFLNACEGAAAGRNWSLEKRFRSVGQAFARGGPSKTVIAPLWPMVNVQAAQLAREFFQHAFAAEALGVALQRARRSSLTRYEQGQPDISWMAYRFFGDPNRPFPVPTAGTAGTVNVSASAVRSRLFGQAGQLDVEVFGFDLPDALLRAAKRRNLQHRAQVTVTDLLAGLVRTGNLTRFVLRSLRTDPDAVYQQWLQLPELSVPGPSPGPSRDEPPSAVPEDAATALGVERVAKLKRLLAQWIVRREEDFTSEVRTVLARAWVLSRARGPDSRVAEHDLLEAVTEGSRWKVAVPPTLPDAEQFQRELARRAAAQLVDENGRLMLTGLTPMARRIIEAAHELSQQRGSRSVLNRLLLASFLNETDGHAASVCRDSGVDPALLAAVLIAGTESHSPVSSVLSPETAQRAVLPMLERARQLAPPPSPRITEALLFQAFCEVVPGELKDVLRKLPPPWSLDLNRLRTARVQGGPPAVAPSPATSPSPAAPQASRGSNGKPVLASSASTFKPLETTCGTWDAAVQSALLAAQEWALIQGHTAVSSVHLAAGLISQRSPLVMAVAQQHQLAPEQLCRTLLRLVRPGELDPHVRTTTGWSKNVQRILDQAGTLGREGGRAAAGERDVWRALLLESSGVVVQALREMGLLRSFTEAMRGP
ncbi:MAG: CHAT domain-containing protein [Planctomycetota bacterium]|nr:CHAT domain-containing protein [Planctomycetota bacterium]